MLLIIIPAILAVVAFILSRTIKDVTVTPIILAGVFSVTTLVFLTLATAYTQGVGEASVIKSFTGEIVGFNAKPGLSLKAPWDDRIEYNILNQQAIFSNPNNVHDDQKKDVKGGEITIGDKDGVSANVDVAIRYSIRADQVIDVFSRYGDQSAFESKLITQDVRDVVRSTPNGFPTLDVLTKRQEVENKIMDNLKTRWANEGVQIDSVALQDVRYPQSVTDKFAAALNARTGQAQAEAELAAAKISSQQQVVQAQAQADANKIVDSSLTPNILQLRSLDTLKEIASKPGNLIITDGKSTPLINVPAQAK